MLKKAAEYILNLSREEQDLILKKKVLQYENDRLQQHLQQYLEGEWFFKERISCYGGVNYIKHFDFVFIYK